MQKYISLKEAARIFGYSSDYLSFLIRKGGIKGKRIPSKPSLQTTKEAILEYLKKRKKEIGHLKDKYLETDLGRWVSLGEAAKISGYHPDYIGWLIRNGKIVGRKIYSDYSWLTTKEEIKNYKTKLERLKPSHLSRILSRIKDYKLILSARIEEYRSRILIRIWDFKLLLSARIDYYKSKILIHPDKILSFSWRSLFAAFIIFVLISELFPAQFFQAAIADITGKETKIVNFYSTQVSGNWQNSQNAKGEPDLGPDADFELFSESNSAVYKGGISNLVLENFCWK